MKAGQARCTSCRERSPTIETGSRPTMSRAWAGPRTGTRPTGSRTGERRRRWRSRSTSSRPNESTSCQRDRAGYQLSDIKLGANCWNQYTTWPDLLAAGRRADALGYHSLWTWDHLYPIVGDSDGPMFEAWLMLAAWAQATEHVRIGLMVGANTFRTPTLTAKMATTLDHISGGRATLGIGAAWFEEEHVAFGIPFGSGFPERLRWLGE